MKQLKDLSEKIAKQTKCQPKTVKKIITALGIELFETLPNPEQSISLLALFVSLGAEKDARTKKAPMGELGAE